MSGIANADVSAPPLLAVECVFVRFFLLPRSQGAWFVFSAVVVRDLERPSPVGRAWHRRRRAALNRRLVRDRARRVRRDPRPERLGQVDARPPALDAAPAGRRRGARLRPRRVQGAARGAAARQPRLGRGELLQEDERGREPRLRGAVLRHGPARDAREDPGDPRARRLPVVAPRRGDGEPLARHAAEGRARARAAHLAGAAAARRADHRLSTRARSRRCRTSSARSASGTTRRSCSARTT